MAFNVAKFEAIGFEVKREDKINVKLLQKIETPLKPYFTDLILILTT